MSTELTSWLSTYGFTTEEIQNGLISSYGYYDMDVLDASVIINLVDKVLVLLVEQFKSSENLHDFFKILLLPAQDLEYTLGDMMSMKNIANGTGNRLDISGAIVGEDRKFKTDGNYRKAIYSKITLNRSFGEPEILIDAIKILTNAVIVTYIEYHPAWIILQFTTFNPLPDDLLKTIIPIAPAGVKLTLTYNNTDEPSFAFSGEGGLPDLPQTEGFGEIDYLEGGKEIGGVFHELISN